MPIEAVLLTKMCVEIATCSEGAHENLVMMHNVACGGSLDKGVTSFLLFDKIKYPLKTITASFLKFYS